MSALLFNSAFGFYVVGLFHSVAAFVSKKDLFHKIAFASVGIGFFLHSSFLVYRGVEIAHLPLTDLKEALAFFAWTVSLCFFISHMRYRIKPVGIFLLPLVTVLMLGTIFFKSSPVPEILRSSWIYWHTICLFLAYGMFFMTFIASLLYLFQERELKGKKPKTFYYWLPSQVLLDDLFYKMLISGFCFMTLGLLAGVIWAEQDWVQGWQGDPKVIAALLTWAIYLLLIYLRLTAGWRGKRAALISMAGFLSILFTFLGARYLGGLHTFQ
ncbi:MAG: cytochrome c biogenesis protein CcsA [Acidobacteriota bacterium]|nr:cytochrome c biogenesis protein CcsA [Acidobacteriota bacterium]